MAATIVGEIDKDAAHAHIVAHLASGTLLQEISLNEQED
jgi:hypothetical protein